MHACMHVCVHRESCMHAYIHSFIHSFIHSCIHTFIHSYILAQIDVQIHRYIERNLIICCNLFWMSLVARMYPATMVKMTSKMKIQQRLSQWLRQHLPHRPPHNSHLSLRSRPWWLNQRTAEFPHFLKSFCTLCGSSQVHTTSLFWINLV